MEFVRRLRPMRRFENLDGLLEAMAKDVAETRNILGLPG